VWLADIDIPFDRMRRGAIEGRVVVCIAEEA
jgi:hypothetical protein